jgi:hypothetical protein
MCLAWGISWDAGASGPDSAVMGWGEVSALAFGSDGRGPKLDYPLFNAPSRMPCMKYLRPDKNNTITGIMISTEVE